MFELCKVVLVMSKPDPMCSGLARGGEAYKGGGGVTKGICHLVVRVNIGVLLLSYGSVRAMAPLIHVCITLSLR